MAIDRKKRNDITASGRALANSAVVATMWVAADAATTGGCIAGGVLLKDAALFGLGRLFTARAEKMFLTCVDCFLHDTKIRNAEIATEVSERLKNSDFALGVMHQFGFETETSKAPFYAALVRASIEGAVELERREILYRIMKGATFGELSRLAVVLHTNNFEDVAGLLNGYAMFEERLAGELLAVGFMEERAGMYGFSEVFRNECKPVLYRGLRGANVNMPEVEIEISRRRNEHLERGLLRDFGDTPR